MAGGPGPRPRRAYECVLLIFEALSGLRVEFHTSFTRVADSLSCFVSGRRPMGGAPPPPAAELPLPPLPSVVPILPTRTRSTRLSESSMAERTGTGGGRVVETHCYSCAIRISESAS